MLFFTSLSALIEGIRRRRADHSLVVDLAMSMSWLVLASVALKPGPKTWLVARAVSLRAF
jgi:hypothetical protein